MKKRKDKKGTRDIGGEEEEEEEEEEEGLMIVDREDDGENDADQQYRHEGAAKAEVVEIAIAIPAGIEGPEGEDVDPDEVL